MCTNYPTIRLARSSAELCFRNVTHPLTKGIPDLWERPLNAWEAALQAAGSSNRTLDTRLRHVRQVARGLGIRNPHEVTEEALLAWCGRQDWMPETRHAYYSSLRGFFKHLYRSTANPAQVLPSVRRYAGQPRPTSEVALIGALDIADERTQLILLLGAQCGLRPFEIAKVHKNDVVQDLLGLSLRVLGKGGKERLVPLEDRLLTHKILVVPSLNGGYLFPGAIDGHLSARWVSQLASRVLPTPWTLHTLRHRFATMSFHIGGKDIIAV